MTTTVVSKPVIENLPISPVDPLSPEGVSALWPKHNLLPERGHALVRDGKVCAAGILRLEYGHSIGLLFGATSGYFEVGLQIGFDCGESSQQLGRALTAAEVEDLRRGGELGVAINKLVFPQPGRTA